MTPISNAALGHGASHQTARSTTRLTGTLVLTGTFLLAGGLEQGIERDRTTSRSSCVAALRSGHLYSGR